MRRGRFITLEGGEGAGKSTQARLLAEALRARGIEVLVTREPGGTAGAERVRSLLLDPAGPEWNSAAEALLFAAARADHVAQAILPALEAGKWVICDRYIDSSRAYQGGAGEIDDADILALHRIGSDNLLPDLTLLIEISPQAASARLSERDGALSDRIGGRGTDYHARVASAFLRMAEEEPGRFVRIDGEGSPEVVHERIVRAVDRLREEAP